MTHSNDKFDHAEIARVAEAIWEAEGRPEGCDHDHWMRARRILADKRDKKEFSGAELPETASARLEEAVPENDEHGARPVQPGFEDVPPGIVPSMKADGSEELREAPAGQFARQLMDLPEEAPAPEKADEPTTP